MNERFIEFAKLTPIHAGDNLHDFEVLAKIDDHNLIAATHKVIKNGLPIGHFSIGAIPLWMAHLSKSKTHPHDTFRLVAIAEGILENRGLPACIALIGKESGIHPKMEELGYVNTGNADVFLKQF